MRRGACRSPRSDVHAADSKLNVFGQRTIWDVRKTAAGRLRNGWPGKSRDDIDDAISHGMVALISDWFDYRSTKRVLAEGDPSKVFAYATRFVYGRALQYFEVERNRNMRNPVDAMVDTADEAMQYVGTVWRGNMQVLDEEFTREEREEVMLARLLAKYEAGGLQVAGENK